MNFFRPVDERFPVAHEFAEWGLRYQWLVDKQTGMWIPKGSDPLLKGQHRGVDFDCPIGCVVSAMADGIIVQARNENAINHKMGAGLFIIQIVTMEGHEAWWLKYSHLKRAMVDLGQEIKAGQPIGITGESGDIDRPLLHVDLASPRVPHQYHPIPWA